MAETVDFSVMFRDFFSNPFQKAMGKAEGSTQDVTETVSKMEGELKETGTASNNAFNNDRVDRYGREVKQAKNQVGGLQSSLKKAAGIAAGIFAGGALLRGAKQAVSAFDAQEKAVADVRQAVKSTGQAAGFTSDELQKMASSLQGNSLFGDEEILKQSTANLLTFTNVADEQFERTQQVALDLATRMDGDLKGATLQLGKALNDPVSNMGALSRAGIQFSESQEETIKTLAEGGNMAEAQGVILKELEAQFGGAAEAAAKAGAGPFQQINNVLGDIQEPLGGLIIQLTERFLPAIKSAVGNLQGFIESIDVSQVENFLIAIGIAAGAFATYKAALLANTVAQGIYTTVTAASATGTFTFSGAVTALNSALAANPIGLVVAAIAALVAGIVLAWRNSETFRGIVIGLWEAIKTLGVVVWQSIKQIAANIFDILMEPVEALKGVWDGIVAFFSGEGADKLIDAFVDLGKSIFQLLSQPFIGLIKLVDQVAGTNFQEKLGLKSAFDDVSTEAAGDVGKSFKEGFDKGKSSLEEEDEAEKQGEKEAKAKVKKEQDLRKQLTKKQAGGAQSGAADPAQSTVQSVEGGSSAESSGPKVFNITIESLIRSQTINTKNLQESSQEIRRKVEKAMVDGIRDSELSFD